MQVVVLCEDGFEDPELLKPIEAWKHNGWDVTLAGKKAGILVEGTRGGTITTDAAVSELDAATIDLLLVPGGQSPDKMRTQMPFVELARNCMQGHTLVAAICHGPQLLIEADAVRGRRLTSWPSVRTDLKNAGAEVVDEAVCVDGALITSRKPDDIPVFLEAIEKAVEARRLSVTQG